MSIKNIIKYFIFYKYLRKIKDYLFLIKDLRNFREKSKKSIKLKIVIGSSNTKYNEWISTNQNILNLTNINTFKKILDENSVDNFLAEHVFEHLTLSQCKLATENCYKFLKLNGVLRIAVPDGYFPNKDYIDNVRPNGSGEGSYDHKQLFNYKTLKSIFDEKYYELTLLEYFDEKGNFVQNNISWENGYIIRSRDNDPRNTENKIKYSSIIIDAKKK